MTEIFVSDIRNFPIDSYAGTVEDGGLSVKLKSFDEFTTHETGRGIKENIGGLNTFRIRGFSGYQPTLYIDTGNNTYIYITISAEVLSPDHEKIFKSLMSTTKNKNGEN
jgi:hypothetical protein